MNESGQQNYIKIYFNDTSENNGIRNLKLSFSANKTFTKT